MCFSAQADVAAGIVVGAIGVSALRQVHRRRDLPLASLPVLFAGHQLVEALVWLDLTDRVSATSGRVALWLYMLFAYVVLPVLVPAAVLAVKTDAARRRWPAKERRTCGARRVCPRSGRRRPCRRIQGRPAHAGGSVGRTPDGHGDDRELGDVPAQMLLQEVSEGRHLLWGQLG